MSDEVGVPPRDIVALVACAERSGVLNSHIRGNGSRVDSLLALGEEESVSLVSELDER